MAKVNLESGAKLSALGRTVGRIAEDMRDELSVLDAAFVAACADWKDKNAEVCKKALDDHAAAMRSAFAKLDGFETALLRLGELAADYENI